MSKKRGQSLEEKRLNVLDIFHETKDVFSLKDIEKLAPKKGVIQQSVKDVLQSLVDDDLVHQEKIGSSNYFWSFPSEAAVKLNNTLKKLEAQARENEQLCVELEQQRLASKQGKEDTGDRMQKLAQLQALEEQQAAQQAELVQYAESDPERYQQMKAGTEIARDAANRWLDNLDSLKKWCKKRFEGMEHALDNLFQENGATDDLDYLD